MIKVNGLGAHKFLANGSGAEFLDRHWGMCFGTAGGVSLMAIARNTIEPGSEQERAYKSG
jgi:uncharacterized membrane protein required for colicin V production